MEKQKEMLPVAVNGQITNWPYHIKGGTQYDDRREEPLDRLAES